MCLVHKIRKVKKNSESGFVLIVALMGIMILLAVGYFALTITSVDMKIASRVVGERKAFSAAETGVHELCRNFNPMSSVTICDSVNNYVACNVQFDPANDPTVRYSYTAAIRNSSMPSIARAGFDLTKSYTSALYDTVVTGEDTAYDSKAEIAVGTATDPRPADTQQGTN